LGLATTTLVAQAGTSLIITNTGLLSLLIDPLMRSLKRNPRYNALLEKIGLPLSEGNHQS
jgi:hypothetical protein